MSASSGGDPHPGVLFGGLGAAVGLVGGTWAAAHIGAALGDSPVTIAANPLRYGIELATGNAAWPGRIATIAAIVLALVLAGLAVAVTVLVQRWRGRDRSIDGRARHLGPRGEARELEPKAAAAKAARLRPGGIGDSLGERGILLGTQLHGRTPVLASFEDTMLLIAGPRRMKTTCYVIPTVVAAPGPVVTTSNKRDAHDATREVRARLGDVWVFDPQAIVGDGTPGFVYNPLGDVASIDDARELAGHFAMGTRSATAQTDAYFDTEAENLLARLVLAAARAGGTLLDAYRWLQNPYDTTPVTHLTNAGDKSSADALQATSQLADKQRDGVYGTARSLVRCLENPAITAWIAPHDGLPQFDPAAFVTSSDTLYSLSEEGEGSAGPLVAALTQAIFNAGRRRATHAPGGRLDPPLVTVLDEAANVVRLRKLPSQYSHFGSQGLPVLTVLQSWSQGTEVWGEPGMKALWGASTVRLYGGGAAESQWLDSLSQLIGEYDREMTSTSTDGRGSRSRSHSTHRERIYSPADLASLPTGRALALVAGHRPMLLQARPWMQGPHADQITHSRATWEPAPEQEVQP